MELWASVMTYWCEGIYGSRWIVSPAQPEQYVRHVAEDMSQWMQGLVIHHAEDVNWADLEILHESFGTGPYPADGWSWLEVEDVLKHLPDIAVAEYQESGSPATMSSFWYAQLVGFLNDIFPRPDGVWLAVERPFASRIVERSDGFLAALLDGEARHVKEVSQLSDAHANWLGRLAVLSWLSWDPPVPREQWQALHRLVTEFNERYAEIGTLD